MRILKYLGYGQELFPFISVIYNSQSCKIAHRDPENQIPGRVVLDNTEFSIKENNHFDPFKMPSQFFPIKNFFSFSLTSMMRTEMNVLLHFFFSF